VSSFKNLLINGDFRFNQRGFAGGSLAANTYGYDRWRTLGSAASVTATAAAITINGTICQIIEAPNLAGQTVTVSVSNPSGPITVKLQPDATTATSAVGNIPAGAGRQSVTLAVPSTLTGNVYVLLSTAASISFDGASKRAGVQLEIGSVATSFDQRPISTELQLCQRYYEKSFAPNVAPAGQLSAHYYSSMAFAPTATRVGHIPFKVAKRATPVVSLYSAAVNAAAGQQAWCIYYSNGTWTVPNSASVVLANEVGITIDLTFSGGLSWGQAVIATGNWTADSEL
jgi:hypothetical protein